MTTVYIPVSCGLVGTLDDCTLVHEDSGRDFPTRAEALLWGYDYYGHDDFRIATVVDGRLTAIGWGDEDFDPAEENLPAVAAQLGYEVAA